MTRVPAAGWGGPAVHPRTWWIGARPRTLGVGVLPVALGAAASGHPRLLPTLAALVVALGLQVGANYANDYFDGVRGVDTIARIGPPRLVAGGLASPGAVLGAAVACLAIAAVVGLWLALANGLGLLLGLGALAVAAALLYTGGPRPYAAMAGLADLAVFLCFGLLATCGTTAVEVGHVTAAAWWVAVCIGLLAVAVLVANNLRDRATDAAAGRRTLVVRLGERGARAFYAGLVVAALLAPLLGALWRGLPWTAAAVLLAVPLLVSAIRLLRRESGRSLAPLLPATVRLHLAAGVVLTVALAVAPAP